MGKNGTGLGALLKSTGGGNPTTIGKQVIGKRNRFGTKIN